MHYLWLWILRSLWGDMVCDGRNKQVPSLAKLLHSPEKLYILFKKVFILSQNMRILMQNYCISSRNFAFPCKNLHRLAKVLHSRTLCLLAKNVCSLLKNIVFPWETLRLFAVAPKSSFSSHLILFPQKSFVSERKIS